MRSRPPQRNANGNVWWIALAALLLLLGVVMYSVLMRGNPTIAGSSTTLNLPRLTPQQMREAAIRLDPELMQHAPPENSFIAEMRTPCWRDSANAMHCLPYVYVTGTFQAGANGLYDKLIKHPHIVQSGASHWQLWGEENKRMEKWVSQLDQSAVPKVQAAPATNALIDGSLSTFGFYWSGGIRPHRAHQAIMLPCWRNCTDSLPVDKRDRCYSEICFPAARAADLKMQSSIGGELHVPLLMSAVYGQRPPKLIVVLRNPAERLHAAFWEYDHYRSKYGKTPEGFLTYLKEQLGALRKCEARGFSMRDCALYFEALGLEEERVFFHCDQIIRGMYSIFLEVRHRGVVGHGFPNPCVVIAFQRHLFLKIADDDELVCNHITTFMQVWLHYFKDNVLVVRSEDYFADSTAVLQRIFKHLGFAESDFTEAARAEAQAAGQPRSTGRAGKPLLPEAQKLMYDFYKPYNEALARVTGDVRYLEWNNVPAVS